MRYSHPDTLRRAVSTLQRTGAANVGGRQQPDGTTFFGRAVAMAMTTPLGAGGARYRLGGAEGPVDTVFLGAFRRDALDAVSGFDPAFVRNQDYELNWRLRARGETVWFDPELVVTYRPRSTFRGLAWQYFDYGRWKRTVAQRHPASLLPRHLASPLLLLGLTASLVLVVAGASWTAAAVPITYGLVLALGSLAVGIRRRSYAAILLPLVLATMHLSWESVSLPRCGPRCGSLRPRPLPLHIERWAEPATAIGRIDGCRRGGLRSWTEMLRHSRPEANQRAGALPGADRAAASPLTARTGNSAFQIWPSPGVYCPVLTLAMG